MPDFDDGSGEGAPEEPFEYQLTLLEQELKRGSPVAREHAGIGSTETTEFLRAEAVDVVNELRTRPDPHREDPFATSDRCLRLVVQLAADRLMSHPLGVNFEPVSGLDGQLRIHVPPNGTPPESLEIRIPNVSRQVR